MKFIVYFIFLPCQLFLFLQIAGSQAPTFPSEPKATVYVVEGESVTLEWTYDLNGGTFDRVTFTAPGIFFIVRKLQLAAEPVISSEYIGRISANVTDSFASITFLAVNVTDDKTYTLTVETDLGGAASAVEMKVQIRPHITHISGNQTVNEGDEVTLNCTADGDPTPSITWTRVSDNSVVNFPLIISRQDQGWYRCTTDNGVGSPATKDTLITVQFPPNISHISGNQTVNEGDEVTLNCTADSNPAPRFTWTRLSDNSSVSFPLIFSRQDQGWYRCTADNDVGSPATKDAFVTVQFPPNITHISGNQTVNEGDEVTLNCTADGNPAPSIAWTRLSDNRSVNMPLQNISRQAKGGYRCTADNGAGSPATKDTFITVQFPPNITHISGNQTVIEGDEVTLNCTADGNPAPSITWTRHSDNSVVNFPLNISRQDQGWYRCTADNSVGSPSSKDSFVTVQYPSHIIHISGDQTVNDRDTVLLNCSANGNPAPSITWRRVSDNSVVNFPLTITGKQDEGAYRCTAENGVGSPNSSDVYITVQNYRPINANLIAPGLTDNTVVVNTSFNLTCSSQANPPAKYRFYRGQESLFNTANGSNLAVYTTSVNTRNKSVIYRCIPFNDYGNGPTQATTVTVHYKPGNVNLNVSAPSGCVVSGSKVTFTCTTDANPPVRTYRLRYQNGSVIESLDGSGVTTRTLNTMGRFNYRCEAGNSEGNATSDNDLWIGVAAVNGTINITLTIKNQTCANFSKGNFSEKVNIILGPDGLVCLPVITTCTSGSAIIGLVLRFNQTVNETYVIAVLKKAAQEGKFGEFVVDPESIKLTSRSSTASPSPSPSPTGTGTGSTQVPVCEETFIKNADCSTIVWKIVVLAVAGVVLIVIVAGIIAWWVHKRRKCRKDSRIHNSEERLHGNAEDNACSQVNHGYAGTGPRPNGTEAVALQQRAAADGSDAAAHQQEAATIPTYAEVDKSKKKKKAEEKLDYTYAEVDKSKKSKKKPKSGEMIYADLEDINVPRPMPTVSTSPQPLPPIKRPEPYENTQYADITQFLKGDATLPQSDSNQGTELQPQGANKDEDGAGGEDRNTPISRQDVQFGIEGNSDAQVNNKYAESGPAPSSVTEGAGRQQRPDANGHKAAANQQAAAAPPTYAAVDKSKKKSKRKKEEEKSPGNSVVDKSQTKKQSDDTYAQVDKSKKSIKKQPNPEGVIYADLEGINMPRMPQVSTSPQPLPPLKRPTPYEGTEYADITEFRKGDTSPKTDDCADPEMQAQGTNKDGIGENNNETSF